MVPSAPELPAIVVMFIALFKPTQVYGMIAALIACLPSWLLRLWVPHAWGVGTRWSAQVVLPRGLGPAPTAEGVPWAGGGALGRRECFPALGATYAGCTGCGATARVDEGAQRAPHPNGLSVEEGGGGGAGVGRWLCWPRRL